MELNLLSLWNQMSLLAAENLLRHACYSGVWLKVLLSRSVFVNGRQYHARQGKRVLS
jgi:hypothetical protein